MKTYQADLMGTAAILAEGQFNVHKTLGCVPLKRLMRYYMYSMIVGFIVYKRSVTYAVSSVIDTTYCDKPWQEIQRA